MYSAFNTFSDNIICLSTTKISIILDIYYVPLILQFQQDFIPQAELEEAFIYIIHKPIDFSYRLKT